MKRVFYPRASAMTSQTPARKPAQKLILLRHAKSDWHSNARSDFERPLNKRGKQDAPKMGRWLAQNGHLPDIIIASPSARTTETVELMRAALQAETGQEGEPERESPRVSYDQRLYHGGAAQIREIAAEQLARFDRVLLVAHNPGMKSALLDYCPATAPFADGTFMPTCAVAVIEFGEADGGNGGGKGGGNAKLCALVRPSEW